MRARPESRWVGVSLRLFSWLLKIYPRDFRQRYGRDMLLTFSDLCVARLAEAGLAGMAAEVFHTIADLGLEIPKSHLRVAVDLSEKKLTALAGSALAFAGAAYVSPICIPVADGEEDAPY